MSGNTSKRLRNPLKKRMRTIVRSAIELAIKLTAVKVIWGYTNIVCDINAKSAAKDTAIP